MSCQSCLPVVVSDRDCTDARSMTPPCLGSAHTNTAESYVSCFQAFGILLGVAWQVCLALESMGLCMYVSYHLCRMRPVASLVTHGLLCLSTPLACVAVYGMFPRVDWRGFSIANRRDVGWHVGVCGGLSCSTTGCPPCRAKPKPALLVNLDARPFCLGCSRHATHVMAYCLCQHGWWFWVALRSLSVSAMLLSTCCPVACVAHVSFWRCTRVVWCVSMRGSCSAPLCCVVQQARLLRHGETQCKKCFQRSVPCRRSSLSAVAHPC